VPDAPVREGLLEPQEAQGSNTLKSFFPPAKEIVDLVLFCGIDSRETAIKAVASLLASNFKL
jgi:hypothetical protein